MFLYNQWYAAMWSGDLGEAPVGRRIVGKPIVLFRTADSGIAVLDDLCPHRFVPLHMGTVIDGERIRCAYHGLEFDGSGACVHNPHTKGRIPPAAKVASYSAIERHGMVWVWLGSATADPGLIPNLWQLDRGGAPRQAGDHHYVTAHDTFTIAMKANYVLIGDNLLDLSHACVLHDTLLGNIEMADAELAVEDTAHGFIVRRLARDTTLPKLFQALSAGTLERGDTWTDMELIGPCTFVNHVGVNAPGKGREGGHGLAAFNILTPVDETTTLYHVGGVLIDPVPLSDAERARNGAEMAKLAGYAFTQQDVVVLEAQQAAMTDKALDTSRPAMFDIDIGSARLHRHLETLRRVEAV